MPASADDRNKIIERILLDFHLIGKGLHRNIWDRESLPVTRPQLGALWMVNQEPDLTVSELARRFMMAKSNVSGTVDRLCRQGLLEKKADDTDQRLVRLRVTEGGQKVLQAAWTLHLEAAQAALTALGDEQLASVAKSLEVLSEALNKKCSGGGD
ncbi:MAG TPA: MarR family transcriptional regulator [Spirochaetia bacterium]|nr:MarR family transcriptional regulator [Spirochaetia bacterium]